ncbi:MAG: hypothetical protein ACK4L7_08150 [Flavobacteriales bacterium]
MHGRGTALYMGNWLAGGGLTQSWLPASTSAGFCRLPAAPMALGFVSAAAKVTTVVTNGDEAPRKAAPPPMLWPMMAAVEATLPKKGDAGSAPRACMPPMTNARSSPKLAWLGAMLPSVAGSTMM